MGINPHNNKYHRVVWPEWRKMINASFMPLIENRDRYLILYGGRGSSKSNFIAKLLIYRCLNDKYFRCILTRKYYSNIRNSSYKTLKDLILGMGLGPMFSFRTQPFEIECINGNMFISAGCDEPQKIKSTKDPTCVWYEEDVVDEESWITITSSIRTTKTPHLQEVFTINPEVEGDYRDHWFFKRFFAAWWLPDSTRSDLNHRGEVRVEIPSMVGSPKVVKLNFTVHHSSYTDNIWLPDEFRGLLQNMKKTNPYYYTIYTLGRWGNKVVGGRFYAEFRRESHTISFRDRTRIGMYTGYNREWPLHITFDFNVRPYMTLVIAQMMNNNLFIIDEIAATEPNNSTPNICRMFMAKYSDHVGSVFVYGDPAGRSESTRFEQSTNEYSIITRALGDLKVRTRVDRKAPPVELRGQFINEIFKNNFGGIRILVDDSCTNMIDDLMYCQEASDGTKFKQRIRDKESNLTHELRGHFTDALDYMLCRLFINEWRAYKRGSRAGTSFKYLTGRDHRFGKKFLSA